MAYCNFLTVKKNIISSYLSKDNLETPVTNVIEIVNNLFYNILHSSTLSPFLSGIKWDFRVYCAIGGTSSSVCARDGRRDRCAEAVR